MKNPFIDFESVKIHMLAACKSAMDEVRNQRFDFISHEKDVIDITTSADLAAQEIIITYLHQHFPKAGIISEEKVTIACTDEVDYLFVIDPLDGTRAYARMQSGGFACMISFIYEGIVCGAVVGDVMSGERYVASPTEDCARRISSSQKHDRLLSVCTEKKLSSQLCLLLKDPRSYSPLVQALTMPKTGSFQSIGVVNGSIGLRFAKVWKGEYGAIILPAMDQTLWDRAPLYCISDRQGYVYFLLHPERYNEGIFEEIFEPFHPTSLVLHLPVKDELLMIHESKIEELQEWFEIKKIL